MMRRPQEGSWHLVKDISVGTVALFVTNILLVGIAYGTLNTRMDNIEKWQVNNNATKERLAIIETQLSNVQDTLKQISRDVRRENPSVD